MKYLISKIPLILSICVLIILVWTLSCKLCFSEKFAESLAETRNDILTISGLLAGLIIAYLTAKVLQIRQEKITRFPELNEQTQKLHKCRSIIDKLIHSRMWPDGVRHFVDNKYKKLTHFDVQEIIFVDSKPKKKAKEFINDKKYSALASLYLELKSFKFGQYPFDQTLYTEFDVPLYYSTEIIQKWINYNCGNGLWYYFDYKYTFFKKSLNLHDIYDGYKEEIKDNCIRIDQERYKDIDFGPELLSKLGTQLTNDILPKLIRIQRHIDSGLPEIIKYLFLVAGILIVFGVSLPLINNIYEFSPIIDIISMGVIFSTSFYLLVSFYGFMKKEIKIKSKLPTRHHKT
ncbi:MAG: hypothetical protein KAV44_09485 [Bacteroidales bacterium]|nr:hypothetical protein [Bacteroidales bacterium]